MAKITPTILGILNTENQSVKDGLTVAANGGSVALIVNYSVPQNMVGDISTTKILTENFGTVKQTVTSVKARQGTVFILTSVFELEFPANTNAVINKNLKWSLESNTLYFSSVNDAQWEIPIHQPSYKTVETAQFRNFVLDASTRLMPTGEDRTFPLCHFGGRDFENQNVWLEFEGDIDLINSIEYRTEAIADVPPSYKYWIYLQKYDANITNATKPLKMAVCAKSAVTGRIIKYTDGLTFTQTPTVNNLDIKLSLATKKFNYKGGVISGVLQYTSSITTLGQITTPSWANFNVTSTSTKDGIVTKTFDLVVDRNTTANVRTYFVTIASTQNSVNRENKFFIEQTAEPNRVDVGIWQDIECSFPSSNLTEFELCDDETDAVLYRGSAYPINGICNLNLREIMANYISADIQFLSVDTPIPSRSIGKYFYDNNSSKVFYVKVDNEIIQTFHVVYNWTFDQNYMDKLVNEYVYLNKPIQRLIDDRQYCFLSRFHFYEVHDLRDEDTLTAVIPYMGVIFTAPLISQTTKINNVSFKIPHGAAHQEKVNKMEIRVNSQVADTFDICYGNNHKYCLYYINKWGGVDWFLFSDVAKESRTISNEKAKFGNRNKIYSKNIKQNWTLKTGLLKDWQSKLMPNMLESTCLYLHDLESDEIFPVNITDSKYDIKTIRNNGRKFYNYTINVESQLDRKIIC